MCLHCAKNPVRAMTRREIQQESQHLVTELYGQSHSHQWTEKRWRTLWKY